MSIALQIVVLGILIIFSALCSSSETAVTSLGRTRVRILAKQHVAKSQALQTLAEDPNRLITTLLILNNLVNVGASSVATILFLYLLPASLSNFQTSMLSTLVMTTLLLVFGEITPKNFAKNNAERYTLVILNTIYYISWFLTPLIYVFQKMSNRILRLFGRNFELKEPTKVSEEQIKALVDIAQDRDLFGKQEGQMIKRIFTYDDLTAGQVMVPRTEVTTVQGDLPIPEACTLVAEVGHSRFPVQSGSIDEIQGTLYSKDLLNHMGEDNLVVSDIARATYYTPITKPINVLLREFQQKRVHLAVVIDEFGGMAGIITLEDILEEIVGEIEDEFDTHEELIEELGPAEALVAGEAEVKHLNRALNLQLPEDDITIGGLFMHYLEDIPEEGDQLTLQDVLLTVEEASEKTIEKVRVLYGDQSPAKSR